MNLFSKFEGQISAGAAVSHHVADLYSVLKRVGYVEDRTMHSTFKSFAI